MSIAVGVDVGGTFTDLAVFEEGRRFSSYKLLTTPHDPSEAIFEGLEVICRRADIQLSSVSKFVHGTTLVANALIERKGATTALLTTEGFRDILEFRTELRYDLFDPHLEFPEPLVARALRFGVAERIDHRGRAVLRPTREDLERICERLVGHGVSSVAVCFLHSYLNPEHEELASEVLTEIAPDVSVSLSSRVLRQVREYERTSATVINAYVQPLAGDYLGRLMDGLRRRAFAGDALIMTSTGGAIAPRTAARFPIHLVESGPAAGVVFAARLSQESLGVDNVVTFDMGGTTAKVCVVREGRPVIGTDHEVARTRRFKANSGMPVGIPLMDILEIGAGGGSIAEVDRTGLVQVGPRSAGASPGPACYGRGGSEPTVTDASLVLGYLAPDTFLGGAQTLDREAAEAAIARKIGEPTGMDVTQAALAIYRVVTASMAEALRVGSVEANVDLRSFDMVSFGGAAGVHAVDIARGLGIERVVCPSHAGIFSAAGLLSAPLAMDLSRSAIVEVAELTSESIGALYDELGEEATAFLEVAGATSWATEYAADMSYVGQEFPINVRLPRLPSTDAEVSLLAGWFAEAYESTRGLKLEGYEARVITWRLRAAGPLPALPVTDSVEGEAANLPSRSIHDGTDWIEARVVGRRALTVAETLHGPAIVQDVESTIVIPRGCAAEVDSNANLLINTNAGG